MSLSASKTSARSMQRNGRDRRTWKRLVQLFLLGGVIWLIATRFDTSEVSHAFARIKFGYFLWFILILIPLAVLLRSIRWRYLLAEGKSVPLFSFVGAYVIGVLANSLLLGKFGDLVKAKLICRSQIDYERSLAVVIIDRLLEGIALLLVFSLVLFDLSLPAWAYRLAWTVALASGGALVGLRSLFDHRDRFLARAESALRFLPISLGDWLLDVVRRLLAGCEVLTDYRRVLVVLLYGLSVWAVEVATVTIFLAAFSIPAPRLVSATVVLVVLNFGTLVPISPGSVGIYQLLCVFALSLWGVDHQLSLALGIAMQAILFIPLYAAGLIWVLVLTWNRNKESNSAILANKIPYREGGSSC